VAPDVYQTLESKLGDHWLGMDIGEQDGRYIGGYAPQMTPMSPDRFEQYLNFQRHFEQMTNELGNKNATLVSLNYGHYFLKEGVYTCIGAETAQGLPNGQVYYAFIRGAGKQYGVPWFGNASVWNRWGYKSYDGEGPDPEHGPTYGTSLALLKRLLYSHILYNSIFVGFESGWIHGDELSPIGKIQRAAVDWVDKYGQPGTMQTPVALLLDFYSGWTFPRHLYTDQTYRVWGNLPYAPGDYLAEGLLDMLYPGYQDSSYFRDERGFVTPTPYGDSADCMLSDAPSWLLQRYPLIVVAGETSGGAELRDKLQAYVEQGGKLVITAGNLAKWPEGFAGVKVNGAPVHRGAGSVVHTDAGDVTESFPFTLLPLALPEGATERANCEGLPVVVDVPLGKGVVTLLASPMGVGEKPVVADAIHAQVEAPLPKPYPLLTHVRNTFDAALKAQTLFEAGEGLSVIACRKGAGEYTLGIANNSLDPRSFGIVSHVGAIQSTEELTLDASEKGAPGYLPTGQESRNVGVSDAATIAGQDVRIFRVRVAEDGVQEIPHTAPPAAPKGRALALGKVGSVKEALLARPTFFEHFDSVSVDWRYVYDREAAALQRESGWLGRQGLRVYVDLTSGLNLYPDLRLLNNDPAKYAESMKAIADVIGKMPALGSQNLIVSFHRGPENNYTKEQTRADLEAALKEVCAKAAEKGVMVYFRQKLQSIPLEEMARIAERTGASNLRLAPSLGVMLDLGRKPEEVAAVKEKIGLWLVSAPAMDVNGTSWSRQTPLADSTLGEQAGALLKTAPEVPVLLDAAYVDGDAEYRDAALLSRLLGGGAQ
jgi:hypothetical protein